MPDGAPHRGLLALALAGLILSGSAFAAPFRAEGPWKATEAEAKVGCAPGVAVRSFQSGKGWGWVCRGPVVDREGDAADWQRRLSDRAGAAIVYDEGAAGQALLPPPAVAGEAPSAPGRSAARQARRALWRVSRSWSKAAGKALPSALSVSYTWTAGQGKAAQTSAHTVGPPAPGLAWGDCADRRAASCFWGPPAALLDELRRRSARQGFVALPEKNGLQRLRVEIEPTGDGLRGIGLGASDHLPHRIWWIADGERQEWRYEEWRALDNGVPVPFVIELWVEGERREELRVTAVAGSGG